MVLLGATPMQFSILSSLGQVSAVFQPLGVALTHRLKKRKKVCIWVTGIGRFLSFFIGAAWFFSDRRMGIIYLLVLLFVSAGLQAIGGNIWIAWVSDLIPQTIRGRFFARRNQILAFAGLIAGYFFGYCTDLFEKNGGLLARFIPNPVVIFNPQNQPFFLILGSIS